MNAIEPEVLVTREGAAGHITLNRPRALNTLNLDMVHRIDDALEAFEEDPDVAVIIVTGEGERAFCAGGDIRMLYDSGRNGTNVARNFFRDEYRLNARIKKYPKPYIAVIDGITMGGGVGLSSHAKFRITTERTRFAMPETGIGFFPDIGASWLLSHVPGELGTFLGLTGEEIAAGDVIAAGLADHFVPSSDLPLLYDALSLVSGNDEQLITSAIERYAAPPPAASLKPHFEAIDTVFSHNTVEDILAALSDTPGEFARGTREIILSKSPTSLIVTLALLRSARTSPDLESCLEREFAATAAVLRSKDFYEGVRAAVIDKDRSPKWSPVTLESVPNEEVAAYFPSQAGGLFVHDQLEEIK